jgi:adenine-specific DNA-methyltransferase
MRKSSQTTIPVEHLRHQDKRINIPTEELRDFVAEEEQSPRSMLYPRDPSLDPQLVWKGKDKQDREPLAVPTVPIYIQEKIHPQAIIEEVRAQAKQEKPEMQMDLFGDFNGIEWEDLVDFYRHEQNWTNRLILGDSLLVMNSLAEKEGLKGQVQMIYMDPPYGIDFRSNWQVSTRKRDMSENNRAEDLTRQPEQIRAFRDTWELGIHSYLSYLRDRLVIARELLTESGSIFVQIGDENLHLLRSVLDEVFRADCHVVTITVKKKGSQKSGLLDPVNDYLLWYSKVSRRGPEASRIKFREPMVQRELDAETLSEFRYVELPDGRQCPLSEVPTDEGSTDYRLHPPQLFRDFPGARLFRPWPITNGGERRNQSVPLTLNGVEYPPPAGRCWSHTARTDNGAMSGMERVAVAGRLIASKKAIDFKRYLDDHRFKALSNWWDGLGGASDPIYVVQTNTEIIKRCMLMTTDPGDLVLDPTCGSGTTAYVAEHWGRRWITTDTSRVALALARTRLMAARFPYYLLVDTAEGIQKEAEATGHLPALTPRQGRPDIRKGLVYKRSRKITSATFANNEEIDAIHARWQEKLEPVREKLNCLLGKAWEEWELPRETQSAWPPEAKDLLGQWWEMRRERQTEIDASIARRADTETLYDQPYEDSRRIRVTGPFTVESLSPHRTLSVDEKIAEADGRGEIAPGTSVRVLGPDNFGHMIIENLKKAGVQNTRKEERLKFDTLEPFAGEWIQAAGEYTDKNGQVRRVAVALGPEYGTVGPDLVKEAAKEALKGIGFDLLLVCGFAFDSHAGETAREVSPNGSGAPDGFAVAEATRQYGKLPVLLTRMNPDLAMGDELLKKTGAGNLFMVFGEPDIAVEREADGKVVLEIRGLDVYDPTTGEIRSSSTDDIACWFVDTDYNEESFFVRHAYFTGAGDPYDKLKRALRAEIDEAAWSSLYATRSRPFDPPSRGKVAVKVINHYGDEVMKVFEISAG